MQLHNTRLMMWATMQPHLKKGKSLNPTDIMELSFDKHRKELKPNVSKEEFIRKSKKIKARWQRIHP